MNQYKNKKKWTKFYNRAAKLIFCNRNQQELLRKVSELSPERLAKREEFERQFCIAVKSAPILTPLLFRPDPKVCPKITAWFQFRSNPPTDGAIKRQFNFLQANARKGRKTCPRASQRIWISKKMDQSRTVIDFCTLFWFSVVSKTNLCFSALIFPTFLRLVKMLIWV